MSVHAGGQDLPCVPNAHELHHAVSDMARCTDLALAGAKGNYRPLAAPSHISLFACFGGGDLN